MFGSQYPNVLAVQFERKLRVKKKQVSPKRNTWSVLYLYDAIYKNPYPFKKHLTFNKVFLCVCFIWGAGPSPLPRHVDHISVQSGTIKVIPINNNQYNPINYTAATRLMRVEIPFWSRHLFRGYWSTLKFASLKKRL